MLRRHVFGHLLFWIILTLMYATSSWGYHDNFQEAIIYELLYFPARFIAVYLNWFVLMPKVLYRRKTGLYFVLLVALIFILAALQRYFLLAWGFPTFFNRMASDPPYSLQFFRVVQVFVLLFSSVAFSSGIKLFLEWVYQKNKTMELEAENKSAELKYLKSQINPHFLFNTLNNLYGLSLEESSKLPKLLLKLSDFLSYSLYDSQVEKIPISEEMDLLKNYADLELDRFGNRVVIDWQIDGGLLDLKIPGLIFMPLLENAFKHGVTDELQTAEISVGLKKENGFAVFEVVNSIPSTAVSKDPSGLGLVNLRRRLELIYKNDFGLITNKEGNQFICQLKIPTHV